MQYNKKYFYHILFVFATSLLFYSCTTTKQTNYLQDRGPEYSIHPYEDYRLEKNDEVSCTILTDNAQFADVFNGKVDLSAQMTDDQKTNRSSSSFVIYENGCISIPFFGDIKIAGLTIPEAENAIRNKMIESIPDAQIRLKLRNNYFFTLSSSSKRGEYRIYKENMTIYQALALSGDVNSSINLSKIKIVRTEPDGRSIVKTFDLRTSSVIESEFYYIKPNDLIYYPTSSRTFWQITSFTAFITTVIAPITFWATMKQFSK